VATGAPSRRRSERAAGNAPEIARWLQDLELVLAARRDGRAASPVRVWSHHFDMDTVLDLGEGRTLALGFSPATRASRSPTSTSCRRRTRTKGALPRIEAPFEIVTDGWIGAVLRGSVLACSRRERRRQSSSASIA
jgi:hypothetical protein